MASHKCTCIYTGAYIYTVTFFTNTFRQYHAPHNFITLDRWPIRKMLWST
jgi:hypothetical protein